jgi:hypothetical protein
MKLDEFLQLDYVMDLYEIFNTRVPVDRWEQEGEVLAGYLTIADEQFKIVLEPGKYPTDHYTYTLINASFEKLVDGTYTRDIQFDSKNASGIVGAISHAIHDKLDEYEFDALVFAAVDNVEQRMRIYNTIIRNSLKGMGSHIPNIRTDNGMISVVVTKNSPAANHNGDLIEHLKAIQK